MFLQMSLETHPIALKELLDHKAAQYNHPSFIPTDPISIPHSYHKRQDVEIAGFWAATLAWGQRPVTIRKCQQLLSMMDHAPHDFILHHQPTDLKPLQQFKHRTFNATDAHYFIRFLRHHYQQHDTLEEAFLVSTTPAAPTIEGSLIHFHQQFFGLADAPAHTHKHIATPARQAACKRLNMYLRWMVRNDDNGVDLGLWQRIKPHQLICPCDVHVSRVARTLGLLQRKQTDWKAATALTQNLQKLCPEDPTKYDFALFGLGIEEQQ